MSRLDQFLVRPCWEIKPAISSFYKALYEGPFHNRPYLRRVDLLRIPEDRKEW